MWSHLPVRLCRSIETLNGTHVARCMVHPFSFIRAKLLYAGCFAAACCASALRRGAIISRMRVIASQRVQMWLRRYKFARYELTVNAQSLAISSPLRPPSKSVRVMLLQVGKLVLACRWAQWLTALPLRCRRSVRVVDTACAVPMVPNPVCMPSRRFFN